MELFTVKRYGDDGEIEKEPEPEEENKILKKLLKKAKKRKIEEEKIKENIETINEETKEPQLKDEQNEDNENSNDNEIDKKPLNEQNESTFQVLGDDVFSKKQKVDMVLPPWLAYPTIISKNITNEDENDNLDNLNYLSPKIVANLKKINISKLFPVQKAVVPSILIAHSKPFPFKPRDICVSAPTGSGKTLAFGIPLIQLLMNRVECKIRALVILPVNELALQVFKVLKSIAEGTCLSICLLSKNFPFVKEQQQLVEFYKGKYYSKVDIIVTTPGRLVEHLHSTKGFCLKELKILIIDEADRIMEQIHFNWLYHLDEHVRQTSDEFFSGPVAPLCLQELEGSLAKQPHKMLFSATLSHDPENLINLKLFQPKLFTTVALSAEKLAEILLKNKEQNKETETKIEIRGEFIGKYTTPSELTEKYCLTEMQTKPLTLFSLIKENGWQRFLCFTNSVDSAFRLAHVLDYLTPKTDKICDLSASLSAKKRAEILDDFTKGKIRGLVCSDTLARGIDIPEVDIVISYDVPRHIITYIHRIGRTARAGRPGTAITLVSDVELKKFRKTLAEAGKDITEELKVKVELEEEFSNLYASALVNLQKKLHDKKTTENFKKSFVKYRSNLAGANNTANTPLEKLQAKFHTSLENKLNKELGDSKIQRKFRKKQKEIKINKSEKNKNILRKIRKQNKLDKKLRKKTEVHPK